MENSKRPPVQISISAEAYNELERLGSTKKIASGRASTAGEMVSELLAESKRSIRLDEDAFRLAQAEGKKYGRNASGYAADCVLDSLFTNERFWKLRQRHTALCRKFVRLTQ